MMEDKHRILSGMAELAVTQNPPATQYECCLIAARIGVAAGDIPRSDEEFIDAAHGQAAGLFGPAFDAADADQKSLWIDMCERALREAAAAPMD